ncbi:hypothetical protein M5K25_004340 [Dendrobium thyrsiflorum]|uniref:Stress-associated endoplasmic reticulum protein n=1 Tax=Dendrobium thyrsiflorum TaxID=117978 RepID=A0ABD0VTB9_DENTH
MLELEVVMDRVFILLDLVIDEVGFRSSDQYVNRERISNGIFYFLVHDWVANANVNQGNGFWEFQVESMMWGPYISGTTSRRLADKKIAKFQKNITKRGSVPETTVKKGNDYPVGPIVIGFFVFVVIGSSLFQIIRTATSGGMA